MVIPNSEMAAAWEHEAELWTEHAARFDRAGRRTWERFLGGLAVQPTEAVLDVGCGTGHSTRELARLASEGSALGLDLSSRMIEYAKEVASVEGPANVSFEHGDAQVHPLPAGHFDLAVSVFGAMFFANPVAAFTNIGRSLRPGGRLAVLSWRELSENEWLTALRGALAMGRDLPEPPSGAPGPFGLADPDQVRKVLTASGFTGISLEPIDEPSDFGENAEDAFVFLNAFGITKGLTEHLEPEVRAKALENLRQLAIDHETPDGVLFGSAAWIVTATAQG